MALDESAVYEGLNAIFRDVFDDDSLVVSASTTAADVPEWDSFNHINLIVAAEGQFGVKFNTNDMAQLKNVGDLVVLILRKTAGA